MKRSVLVLAAAAAMALAACGGSSATATTAAATTAAPETKAEETKAEETKAEETKAEETKAEETKAEETKAAADSDVAYIQGKGTLIVGITDFAPMDYKEGNEWIGFDADIAKKVAESLGVTAEFVEIDWDNKILELNNKSIDVVWNGMTLTPEVASSMNCTKPYCNNAQVVVLKKEDAEKYADAESMKELSFAVEAGSAGEAAAEENGFNFTAVTSQADTLLEVSAGTSDASIIDLLMAGAMVGEGTSYEQLTHTLELTTEEYVVGCRKDSDLAEYINSELKAYYDDGSLMETAKVYGVQDAIVEQ